MSIVDCPAPAVFLALFFCPWGNTLRLKWLAFSEFGIPWVSFWDLLYLYTPFFSFSQGLVLGIYSKEKEENEPQFTSAGENFNKLVSGKLREILNMYVFIFGFQFFKFVKEKVFSVLVEENAQKYTGQDVLGGSESKCLWIACWYFVAHCRVSSQFWEIRLLQPNHQGIARG